MTQSSLYESRGANDHWSTQHILQVQTLGRVLLFAG